MTIDVVSIGGGAGPRTSMIASQVVVSPASSDIVIVVVVGVLLSSSVFELVGDTANVAVEIECGKQQTTRLSSVSIYLARACSRFVSATMTP